MTLIDLSHGSASSWGGQYGYTMAVRVSFDIPVLLSRVGFLSDAAYSAARNATPRIWNSSRVLLTSGSTVNGVATPTMPLWAPLSYSLAANTPYYIGGYMANGTMYRYVAGTHTHIQNGFTTTITAPAYYQNGDTTTPTDTGDNEFAFVLDIDRPNTLPTAPTGLSAAAPTVLSTTVSWTHDDTDGNQAARYQIRYRKVDT